MSFELAGGSSPNIQAQTSFTPGSISLMTIDQDGNAGVLPPGYTAKFMVNFKTTVTDTIAHDQIPISLVTVGTADSTTDLGTLVGALPNDLSSINAQILAAQLNGLTDLPNTLGRYQLSPNLSVPDTALVQRLDQIASLLSSVGTYEPTFDNLLAYAASAADNFGAITAAHKGGAFGFGAAIDPYRIQLLGENGSADVALVTPTGSELFSRQPDSTLRMAGCPRQHQHPSGDQRYHLDAYRRERRGLSFPGNRFIGVSTVVDPSGLTTTYNYGANETITSIVAPGNLTTTFTYGSGSFLNIIGSTDPAGNVTTYGYTTDAQGFPLLTSVTTPAGTTTIAYEPSPAITNGSFSSSPALAAYLPVSITLPDGSGRIVYLR